MIAAKDVKANTSPHSNPNGGSSPRLGPKSPAGHPPAGHPTLGAPTAATLHRSQCSVQPSTAPRQRCNA